MATVIEVEGQAVPPGLSVFQLPAVGSLAVAHPNTLSDPFHVFLSSGVVPDSAGLLVVFRQKPALVGKNEHGRPGDNPESTLPTHQRRCPSTKRVVSIGVATGPMFCGGGAHWRRPEPRHPPPGHNTDNKTLRSTRS
jgi:hypothetical protein